MTELKLENISVSAGGAEILKGVSATFRTGELAAIIGPNGAGKTTLLKSALGLTDPHSGSATVGGAPVASLSPIERARRIAYLPQARPLVWPARVRDVIALGRYAYGANLSKLKDGDAAAVEQAIKECDLAHLADRSTDGLSGGELARVHCARAFASQTPLLLADEPIAALDPYHQFNILGIIRRYVNAGGGAAIVLHDIALAARFADRLIWMKDGEVVADGPPDKTLTNERMREVFKVSAEVSNDGKQLRLLIAGGAP